MAGEIRNGKGHRAYRRRQAALRRRTQRENLPCGYGSTLGLGCGEAIDTELPSSHRMSFTADHDQPLAAGGRLASGLLVPMHRACNSRKGDYTEVEIWAAS